MGALDVVWAWRNHTRVNGQPADVTRPAVTAQLRSEGGGAIAVSHSALVGACKQMALGAGLRPGQYASHSLRRGGACYAFQMGVPEALIQRQGDWKSACYKEYLELSREQHLACSRRMLQGVANHEGMHELPVAADADAPPMAHLPRADLERCLAML